MRRPPRSRSCSEPIPILAYGGTGLFDILRANLAQDGTVVAHAAALLGSLGLRALEPAFHLPHLAGEFLLINGRDDPRIPARSAAGLHRLTPHPKHVRFLSAGHFDAGDQQLLDEILALCRSWLTRRQALNR